MADPILHTTRFEDRGIGPGGSDYLGWTHVLEIADRVYALRQYADDDVIAFMSGGAEGNKPIRGGVPYADPVFARAASWLVQLPSVERLIVLTSDPEFPDDAYAPVDPSRLVGEDRSPYVI